MGASSFAAGTPVEAAAEGVAGAGAGVPGLAPVNSREGRPGWGNGEGKVEPVLWTLELGVQYSGWGASSNLGCQNSWTAAVSVARTYTAKKLLSCFTPKKNKQNISSRKPSSHFLVVSGAPSTTCT